MTLITFIIPMRHPDNARDWSQLTSKLTETLASISNQNHSDWRCILVVNRGAPLPPLPEKVSVTWVDFPANQQHDIKSAPRDVVLDIFRADKGRRVLRGMLDARDSRFFMIVDDDDLISAEIVDFVSRHIDADGWYISDGYLWQDGGGWLFPVKNFDDMCGTSLIVRADAYDLPESFELASITWIKDMLGSHQRIKEILKRQGRPLQPLPFCGAVYRVGNSGSHSQGPGLIKMIAGMHWDKRRPDRLLRKLMCLRPIVKPYRDMYFGA